MSEPNQSGHPSKSVTLLAPSGGCAACGQIPKPPGRTIADEIEEYKNMPEATKSLIHRLTEALIEGRTSIES